MGATSTRPTRGRARGTRSPRLGRWNVTVTSARTTGVEGSPELRSSAVGASTARTGTPGIGRADGHVDAPADGLAERAPHPGPKEGVDHEPGSLDPVEE